MKQSRFMSSHFFHQRAISTEPGKKKNMPEQQPLGTTYNTNHGLSPSAKLKTNSSHPQGLKGNLNLLHLYNIYMHMYYLFVYLFKKKTLWYICTHIYIYYKYIYIYSCKECQDLVDPKLCNISRGTAPEVILGCSQKHPMPSYQMSPFRVGIPKPKRCDI